MIYHPTCDELWKSRGAQFISEPIPKYGETCCYIRDPVRAFSSSPSPDYRFFNFFYIIGLRTSVRFEESAAKPKLSNRRPVAVPLGEALIGTGERKHTRFPESGADNL